MSTAPVLEGRALSMTFPGVRALDEVGFDVRAGEVHALVGQNGAGKSTLIKILSGDHADYTGELLLDGAPVRFSSPADGLRAGIALIPQELQLVSTLDAAANIFLGREPRAGFGLIDADALAAHARSSMRALDEPLRAGPVGRLEPGQRQLVAIARALSLDARVLVMDEPTSSLDPDDARRLEALVVDLTRRGVGVVYVSHRLDEVCRLAARITVLRDGRVVRTLARGEADEAELVRLMAGRRVVQAPLPPVPEGAAELLRVEGLSLPDPARPGGYRLRDVSLTLHRGEILGLAGLVGAGRSDFLLTLAGTRDRQPEGRVILDGRPYRPRTPAAARDAGLVLLPEDRKDQGIFPHLDVVSNVTVTGLDSLSPTFLLDRRREAREAGALMEAVGVRCPSPLVPIATLSGGNQQKALLARCLFASPSVLLLDEPTRGVDVAAKQEIYGQIAGLAAKGFGIIVCSSEMQETIALSHRIVVFREGRIAGRFERGEANEERLLAAATGTLGSRSPDDGRSGDSAAPPPSATPPGARRRGPRLGARLTGLIGLAAVLALAIVTSPVRGGRPVFLDVGNLTDILRQVAEKGILAAGMTPVIIAGGIDLSVGSILALAATLTGSLFMRSGLGLVAVIPIVLAVGALWGLLNGLVVSRWRLQAFIATLATMSAARGVARYVSGGAAIPLGFGDGGAPEAFRVFAAPILPFVPVPAVLFLVSVAAVGLLMSRMRAGRYVYAIGDNERAARLSGVNVARYKTLVYVLSASLAALAGIIHCAQLEQGNPNDGIGYELDAIAAVVIGGTSLSGGVGTVGGTLVGTLIIGIINNSMGLNNVDANLQLILKGAIILAAVWLQTRRR